MPCPAAIPPPPPNGPRSPPTPILPDSSPGSAARRPCWTKASLAAAPWAAADAWTTRPETGAARWFPRRSALGASAGLWDSSRWSLASPWLSFRSEWDFVQLLNLRCLLFFVRCANSVYVMVYSTATLASIILFAPLDISQIEFCSKLQYLVGSTAILSSNFI